MGDLKTLSVLRADVSPSWVESLFARTINQLKGRAIEELKGKDVTMRDLAPDDFPGLTTQDWGAETSGGTDNAYADTAVGNGGAIADETFLAVMGCALHTAVVYSTGPTITQFRFTIGGSRVAQWDLHNIYPYIGTGTVTGDILFYPKIGWSMTPVIVTQNQTLLVQEYVTTASTAYRFSFYGVVAEPVGRVLNL